MKLKKYTIEELREAVAESYSIRASLKKLGLAPQGGNYRTFHRAVEYYDIDTSHFTGKAWSSGKKLGPNKPIEYYLTNQGSISSYHLKNRLLNEGLLEYICVICNNTEWMGEPIPLQLDHINGQHYDNSLENIRLLCPNCHALTSTFRGRNIGKAEYRHNK